MIGNILIWLSAILSIASAVIYFMSYNKENPKTKIARILYISSASALFMASVFLLSNILGHNFQYAYIFEYSSKELPFYLLVSSFYSGQEGSFLLWGLLVALSGILLLRSSQKQKYEELVMGFFALILFFIVLLLVFKSPFQYLWQKYPDHNLTPGFSPENGKGLNPILENYWLAIHPPILFLGYALMTVPFVYALAAMIRRDYQNWINISRNWVLVATAILGIGIMLGGFWAYETLGWGGFWGWDPVENSSLMPWLVAVAFVHTLLVQRRTGGLVKTNLFLAILSFLLVIYATFLTRSGILGDTSVHSFTDPGKFIYTLLVIIQVVFALYSFGLLIVRSREITSEKMDFTLNSKEFGLSMGSIIVMAMTFIVFIGTSWPLLAGLFAKPKAAVDISFYNNWTLPLAFLIMIFNAISVYLSWKKGSYKFAFSKTMISILLSVILTLTFFFMGMKDLKYSLLTFAALYSLFVNIDLIFQFIKTNPVKTGAYLSHLGVAILMLGVVAGSYSQTHHLRLKQGEKANLFGYSFTFTGKTQIEKDKKDREKFIYHVNVQKDGESYILNPVVYVSDFNQRMSPFYEPGIKSLFTRDLYIAPKNLETGGGDDELILVKGMPTPLIIDTNTTVTLIKFEMSDHMTASGTSVRMGTILDFNGTRRDTIYGEFDISTSVCAPEWKKIENTDYEIGFIRFMVDKEMMSGDQSGMSKPQAVFNIKKTGEQPKEQFEIFTIDVTIKPYMNLVWLGTICLVAGFFVVLGKKLKIRE